MAEKTPKYRILIGARGIHHYEYYSWLDILPYINKKTKKIVIKKRLNK